MRRVHILISSPRLVVQITAPMTPDVSFYVVVLSSNMSDGVHVRLHNLVSLQSLHGCSLLS